MSSDLVLASGSASRRRLLENAGLTIQSIKPLIDEDAYKAPMRASKVAIGEQAMRLAELKALKVSQKTDALVIGGDQMLNLDGEAFDKPPSLEAAKGHLTQLSGKTHILETALCIAQNEQIIWRHLARPKLSMRTLSPVFIDDYVAICGHDLCNTVGAYMVEGRGAQLFTQIDGDFFSVLGLPLFPLLAYLRDRGVLGA